MNLDTDLQRILNVGAKVYNTKTKRQGKVIEVSDSTVSVDYGNSAKSEIDNVDINEFKQHLASDEIVANYRLTMGSNNNFKVLARTGAQVSVTHKTTGKPSPAKPKPDTVRQTQPSAALETGYINFKTNRFSKEPKKGYTKVEYRKATQKVTLEIDEDQLKKLKEMGLV